MAALAGLREGKLREVYELCRCAHTFMHVHVPALVDRSVSGVLLGREKFYEITKEWRAAVAALDESGDTPYKAKWTKSQNKTAFKALDSDGDGAWRRFRAEGAHLWWCRGH